MRHGRHLVIGAGGTLGSALLRTLRAQGDDALGVFRRADADCPRLDLSKDPERWPIPEGLACAYLCAAVTSTDACRRHPAATRLVNVEQTLRLAERLLTAGCFVVFPSTNLVFDGATPRCPADAPPSPRLEYGRQKAEAEARLLALGGGVAVLRLSKVLAPGMPLLSKWAQDLSHGHPVAPFLDMVMSPLPLALAVEAMLGVAQAPAGGLWQLSASEDMSYARAAQIVARRVGAPQALVRPVRWRDAQPDLEHVPAHTTLDSSRFARELGLVAPSAQAALEGTLEPPQ